MTLSRNVSCFRSDFGLVQEVVELCHTSSTKSINTFLSQNEIIIPLSLTQLFQVTKSSTIQSLFDKKSTLNAQDLSTSLSFRRLLTLSRRTLTLNRVENGANQERKPRLILSLSRASTKLQITKLKRMLICSRLIKTPTIRVQGLTT